MQKIFKTKVPVMMYVQIIAFTLLALMYLRRAFQVDHLPMFFIVMYVVFFLVLMNFPLFLLIKILKKNNTLELTSNKIKLNNVEVEIQKIEKIIIQGYFTQSIGIKLYGKRNVKNDLHFRFKYDEENNIEEFKQWAVKNGIVVTDGRIYRWI